MGWFDLKVINHRPVITRNFSMTKAVTKLRKRFDITYLYSDGETGGDGDR